MALQALGISCNHVFACENDKFARIGLLANFKPKVFYEDITTRNHSEVGPIDLYIAGFPCQSFSISGKRLGFEDVRGTLFFDMAKFININKPKVFILENVKGLLSHDKPKGSKAKYGNTFNSIINLLAKTVNTQYAFPFYNDNIGYHVYYKVLNSVDFGAPQNRERIFIIGFRDDEHTFSFPSEVPLELRLKDLLEDEVDEKYYLSEKGIKKMLRDKYSKPQINPQVAGSLNTKNNAHNYQFDKGTTLITQLNPSKESGCNQPYQQNRIYDVHGISPAVQAEMSCKSYAIAIPKQKIIKYKYDEHQQDAVFDSNGISPTLQSSGEGHIGGASAGYLKFLIENRIRRLTPLECFRLQDIPDEMYYNIKKTGMSDTQLYKQAGNAMTRSVMMALFKKVLPNLGIKNP